MKKVLVMMSTYNGEKYIQEQINSILQQNKVDITLLIRDDGSKDETISIINEFQKEYVNVLFLQGENLGPANSFIKLLNDASDDFDYYAFSDQDDVWKSDKISRAISLLEKDIPSLYCSSVTIANDKLEPLYTTKITEFSATELMLRNNVQGCTMVMNGSMKKKINEYIPKYLEMHDSWILRVATFINAKIVFDEYSGIYYRQHENNVIGKKNWNYIKNKTKKI
ncbi:glycosyltransferase family 2 protein [Vagococcus zengguangii]